MGARRVIASRIESTRSTPPVEPEVFDPWVATIGTSGRQAFVAMVQAAHLGERDDLALLRTLHWSWFRGHLCPSPNGSDCGGSMRNRI